MAELKAARKKTADMTNVKDKGPFNPKHMAEGDYLAKIVEVYETRNKDDTKDMWVIAFQLQDRRDVVYPYYCTWDDNQLWKVRNVFEACGVKIPKKRVALDPIRIRNKMVGITLEDDEYDGKPKSVIAAVMSVKDMEDGPSADDDEDVDDEDDVEEEEVEETPPPRKRRAKKAPEPEPEDDDEDEEEDEEEEEPEPPKRRKKASPTSRAGGRSVKGSTKVATKKRKVVEEDDDEDLDEMDIDEEDL